MKIFISYAKEDYEYARRLFNSLRAIPEAKPWLDRENILPGMKWEEEILAAIKDSQFVILLLSNNSIDKFGFFQREVKKAIEIYELFPPDKIFLIPARINDCKPKYERLKEIQWVDLFPDWDAGINRIIRAIFYDKEVAPVKLRGYPNDNLKEEDVKKTIKEKDFYDNKENWTGKGIHHLYETIERNGITIILDHTTGLCWQKSGSKESLLFSEAKEYINILNKNSFFNYTDWRFPTIDEAMSLMEPTKSVKHGYYINSLFDKTQRWIWTNDLNSLRPWVALFYYGHYYLSDKISQPYYYVRAVRSM